MMFTKGPWSIAPCSSNDETRDVVSDYKEEGYKRIANWIAELDAQTDGSENDDDRWACIETMEANARLIAAAPELYEALQRCAELLDDYSDVNDGEDGPVANRAMSLLRDVEAALAKADGGK